MIIPESFKNTKISSISTKFGQLITADENDSFLKGLVALYSSHSLSVPVLHKDGSYTFFDVLDVVKVLNERFSDEELGSERFSQIFENYSVGLFPEEVEAPEVQTIVDEKWGEIKSIGSLGEVAGKNERNKFVKIDESATIEDAIKMMESEKVHRLGVMEKEANLVGVVTQTDILNVIIHERTSEASE